MPYVFVDAEGLVAAVYAEPVDGAVEVAIDDPRLADFHRRTDPDRAQREEWIQSDLGLARVLEDLVDVLIEKKVIMFTDLPEGAQQKLLERRGLRKEFAYVDDLFGDEKDYGTGEGGQGGGGYL